MVNLIKSVDQFSVEATEYTKSLGFCQIPPTRLFGKTNAADMMKYCLDCVINASNCSDNCTEWILKHGNESDLTISLHHIMDFPDEGFEIEILTVHSKVYNMCELVNVAIDYL